MDRFEEAVLEYISAKPSRLLKSQFRIPYDKESRIGGTWPDFLALDFDEECVYIVEVTTAYDISRLVGKVHDRQNRWYEPIKNSALSWHKLVNGWDFRVCLVLRSEVKNKAEKLLVGSDDVSIKTFDQIMSPWRWDWQDGDIAVNSLK